MGYFKVEITEKLKKTVIIKADSLEKATEAVEEIYNQGKEIILTDNDYYGDFETEGSEITEEEFIDREHGGTQVVSLEDEEGNR